MAQRLGQVDPKGVDPEVTRRCLSRADELVVRDYVALAHAGDALYGAFVEHCKRGAKGCVGGSLIAAVAHAHVHGPRVCAAGRAQHFARARANVPAFQNGVQRAAEREPRHACVTHARGE